MAFERRALERRTKRSPRRCERSLVTGGIVIVFMLFSGGAGPLSLVWAMTDFLPVVTEDVIDGERLRWEGIHRQETYRTCGPATVVTLLDQYFGIVTTEEEVARRALGADYIGDDRVAHDPAHRVGHAHVGYATGHGLGDGDGAANGDADRLWLASASLLGLRDALHSWGIPAYGMKMPLAGLIAYLGDVDMPLIVRINHPEPHFTLVTRKVGDYLLLADSALGWRTVPVREFPNLWDGYVLVVAPAGAASFSARPDDGQARELADRLRHLRQGVAW